MILIASLLTAALIYQDHAFQKRTTLYEKCVAQQITLYGDLCAESSSGYENMSGSDAHYEGVVCAVESVKTCKAM